MIVNDLLNLEISNVLGVFGFLCALIIYILPKAMRAIDEMAHMLKKWRSEPEYEGLCNFARSSTKYVSDLAIQELGLTNAPAKTKNRFTAAMSTLVYGFWAIFFYTIFSLLILAMVFTPNEVDFNIYIWGMLIASGSCIFSRAMGIKTRQYYFALFPPKK